MNSKWMMFKKLYKREMYELKTEIYAIIIFTLVANMLFYIWPESGITTLPLFLSFVAVGLVPLFAAIRSLSKEWNNNTIYLIKSLPVSGNIVLSSKILSILSEFIICSLVVGIIVAVFFSLKFFAPYLQDIIQECNNYRQEILQFIKMTVQTGLLTYLTIVAGFFYTVSIIFLSQLIARIAGKYMRLISVVSFFVFSYLGGLISGKVIDKLPWLNNISNWEIYNGMHAWDHTSYMTASILSTIAVTIIIGAVALIAGGLIYDKKLEI